MWRHRVFTKWKYLNGSRTLLYPLAEPDGAVFDFAPSLGPTLPREPEPVSCDLPEQIPDGQRTTAMVSWYAADRLGVVG